MLIARIHKHESKVYLYDNVSRRTVTVTRSGSIQIELSEDEDLWLITVRNKSGAIIVSMFADRIEKGGY